MYLPLLEPYESVAHPSEEKRSSYQWRGIADCSALPTLDRTVQPGGSSMFLSAKLKKDGQPYSSCDLARREDFAALMSHTAAHMGKLADDLIDGNIDVNPYRLRRHTPCTWCQYRAVCRYEFETQPPRSAASFEKSRSIRGNRQIGGNQHEGGDMARAGHTAFFTRPIHARPTRGHPRDRL